MSGRLGELLNSPRTSLYAFTPFRERSYSESYVGHVRHVRHVHAIFDTNRWQVDLHQPHNTATVKTSPGRRRSMKSSQVCQVVGHNN